MTELARRRRALMGKKGDLLYELRNYVIQTDDAVKTGVFLFEDDIDWSILTDVTITSNPTSGNSRAWKLLAVWSSVYNKMIVAVGKNASGSTSLAFQYGGNSQTSLAGTTTAAGRIRYIVSHKKGSDKAVLFCKCGSGATTQFEISAAYLSVTNQVVFGASASSGQALPPGTITLAQIWAKELSSDERSAFFA